MDDAAPPTTSMREWSVGERAEEGIVVRFVLWDCDEARAWAGWLIDRHAEATDARA